MKYSRLSKLKKLPNNPRIIRDKQFKTLCDSIRDNPKYFEARPLILSNRTGDLVIIAGNQRYEAAKSLKLINVPTFLMEGLTEEKEKEIIIRDNISNGEFDFSILANEWSDLPLIEWGIELPEDWLKEQGEPQDAEPQIDNVSRQCLWQRNHPDKFKAQSLCKSNPEKVIVLYECCCESDDKKHNHHFDYSRAFEVINLCEKCHTIEHLRLRKFEEEN